VDRQDSGGILINQIIRTRVTILCGTEGCAPHVEADTGIAPVKEQRALPTWRAAGRELIETVLLTIIVFLLIRSVVRNYKVDGYSMEPTLDNGQYLLVNKAAYWFGGPHEGDIVIMRYPLDPKTYYVKRVIGLPGDTVEIRQGKVLVNDDPLEETYISSPPAYSMAKQVVRPQDYFVLGDNRNNSSDSHVWGMLPAADVVGKAFISYWPPKRWGMLPHASYAKSSGRDPTPHP